MLHNRHPSSDNYEDPVSVGDLVVIPRGAPHVFSTELGGLMEYIALEFSDAEIDYQAHLPCD